MNITDLIVNSPNGGTASLVDGELPVTGYFVGGVVSSLILDSVDRDEIEVFVTYLLAGTSAEYVGWWVDSETGKLYVDGVSWYTYQERAAWVAGRRHEIAFWDIEQELEIRLAEGV